MPYIHRNAVEADLPRIVEIYNFAVATRKGSCDLEPTTVEARLPSFREQSPDHRPLWVAEDSTKSGQGAFITADIAIYLHPDYQGKGLGPYLIQQAISVAPSLGIETLTATIFASNEASIQLFDKMGFER